MPDPDFVQQTTDENKILEQAALLVSRLERISADSIWAHRSSGLRGSLLRILEGWEASAGHKGTGYLPTNLEDITRLIEAGFYLLENAAREY